MIGIVVVVVAVVAACVLLARFNIVSPTAPDQSPSRPSPRPAARPSPGADPAVAVWLVCGPVAMVGAAGCAVIAATTFLPDPLAVPRWVVVAVALPVLPICLLSVVTARRMRRKHRSVLSTIESVAPNAWPIAALLFAAFAVITLTSFGGPAGDPTIRHGRYYLVSHGVATPITREQYARYEPLERRSEAGVCGGLYSPGIALGMYMRERHRRSKLAPTARSSGRD
jgi:hypothetical protein